MTQPDTHPAADIFPMMSGDDLQALADDIAANGQRQPIVLDAAGRILDGRNRWAACELAGVEPLTVTANGSDPVALVVSLNVKRRNLTAAQRAVAAAEAWDLAGGSGHGGARSSGQSVHLTRQQLASQFGVGEKYVQQARALTERASDLAALVKDSTKPLADAYEELRGREGKAKGERAQRDRLRDQYPDLLERVDADEITVADALAEGAKRDADHKQRRWAATMNVLDGIRLLEQPADTEHVSRAAELLNPALAAERGEDLNPQRLRAAAAFATALADAMEATA